MIWPLPVQKRVLVADPSLKSRGLAQAKHEAVYFRVTFREGIAMQARQVRIRAAALVLTTALAGCGGQEDSSTAPQGTASGNVTVTGASADDGAGRCLLARAETPCSLLDVDLVRGALPGLDEFELAQNDPKSMGSGCSVSWNAGRTTNLGEGLSQMEFAAEDSVAIGAIKPYTSTNPVVGFRLAHRTPDAAAREQAVQAATRRLDQQQTEGRLSAEDRETALAMAARMLDGIQWEEIVGLGDAAAWGGTGRFRSLEVLVGTALLNITAELSNSADENRDAAVAVARAVIERCR